MIRGFSKTFGASTVFQAATRQKISRDLKQSFLRYNPDDYLSFAAFASLALPILPVLLILGRIPIAYAALAFIAVAAASLIAFLNASGIIARKRAERIEAELPAALRTLSIDLSLNTPFEKALFNSAQGHGELSKELQKTLANLDAGASVHDAFQRLADATSSEALRRAAMQLLFAYEHGLHNEGLRKLAEELSSAQRAKVKVFHSQTAFLGLVFTASACVIPALFSAYTIVGSSFLQTSITPEQVFTMYVLIFPLANVLILLYLREQTPAVIS